MEMINLLPDVKQDEIRAARSNVILLRYMFIIILAFAFILSTLYVSYIVLQQTMQSAQSQIESNDTKADIYNSTRAEVDSLSANLSGAKEILNLETRYSQFLTQLGNAMPENTILGDLKIDAASFGGQPLQVTAYAKTSEDAAKIKDSLQASGLFTQVDLGGTNQSTDIEGYEFSVSLAIGLAGSVVQ